MTASLLYIVNSSYLSLKVRVEDADFEGFDRLEVWRSVMGEAGPYEELSHSAWSFPVLPPAPSAEIGLYVNVSGKGLELLLNESVRRTVLFTGVDPLPISEVAAQITAQTGGLVTATVNDATLAITGKLTGGGASSLRVLGGEAAPSLGLEVSGPQSVAFGADPRPVLELGQSEYSFVDYFSQPTYFYKTRFRDSVTGTSSSFSKAIAANMTLSVDPGKVAVGFVKLVRGDGRPARCQEISVFNAYQSSMLDGATIVGGPESFLTDDTGYAEFTLLRGLVVDVGIAGTALVRRVTVPTDPSVLKFNVLDPAYGVDDAFAVVDANLPYAARTTL